jgi:hypothetical protein
VDKQSLIEVLETVVRRVYGDTRSAIAREGQDAILREELDTHIAPAIRAQPEFASPELMMAMSDEGASFNLSHAAGPMLVARAREYGSEKAVNWLARVVASEEASGVRVLPLWGVEIAEATGLTPRVSLIPFSKLPDSPQKQALQRPPFNFSARTTIPQHAWQPPTSALMARTTVRPVLSSRGSLQRDSSAKEELRLVRQCLSLIGPTRLVSALEWFQFEDEDLASAVAGTLWNHESFEIHPLGVEALGPFDPAQAAAISSALVNLTGKIRNKLQVSIRRFDQAMHRHDPGDAAVELSTALEAILGQGQTELTWQVSLRSALLVPGTKSERLRRRAVVQAIYSLRSAVVHEGMARPKFSIRGGGKIDASALVAEGKKEAARVIKAVILHGSIPDWFEYEIEPTVGSVVAPNWRSVLPS